MIRNLESRHSMEDTWGPDGEVTLPNGETLQVYRRVSRPSLLANIREWLNRWFRQKPVNWVEEELLPGEHYRVPEHVAAVRLKVDATSYAWAAAAQEQNREQVVEPPRNVVDSPVLCQNTAVGDMNPFRRAGLGWSTQEEEILRAKFSAGRALHLIASDHGRSVKAITARLERLGLIQWHHQFGAFVDQTGRKVS